MTNTHRRIRSALLKELGDIVRYLETKNPELAREVQRRHHAAVGRTFDQVETLYDLGQVKQAQKEAVASYLAWKHPYPGA